jgi:hypothetical protein
MSPLLVALEYFATESAHTRASGEAGQKSRVLVAWFLWSCWRRSEHCRSQKLDDTT